jgi:S-adenosylmethionine uptake transporter
MQRLSPNTLGAIFMMVSMLGFALNDAAMKAVLGRMDLFQALFLRGLAATALIGVLAVRRRALRPAMTKRDPWFLALRLVSEIGGAWCFLNALAVLPIALAAAILQVMPLAVTLAAAVFMREPLGWRRLTAILVGFAGVLLIVRPGAAGFDANALWAVAAVGFFVGRDLSTRSLSHSMHPAFVTLATALVLTAMGGIGTAAAVWTPVTAQTLVIIGAAAVLVLIGYFFGVEAMRSGEIAMVSPFRYTILLWAMLAGALLFGEIPDALSLLGAAVVVGAGLYAFRREAALRRAALRAGNTPPDAARRG